MSVTTVGCRDNRAEGKELLLRSLHAFPWNWSAWLALGTLQGSADLDADSALPRHWMRNFFLAHVCVEGQENEEALGRLSVRPSSACLLVTEEEPGQATHALHVPFPQHLDRGCTQIRTNANRDGRLHGSPES